MSVESIVSQVAAQGAQTPAPPAAQTAPVAPPAPAAEAPKAVPVSPEEWAAIVKMREDFAKVQADQREREAKAREEQIKAMTQKGEIENAFRSLREDADKAIAAERQRLSEVETRAKRYALDGELARALASHPLVPGGAEQLTQLWRSQFVVEPSGDSFKVQSASGFQPVGEFVKAQLASPTYAHFIRAQNPGGGTAGTTGGHQAAPTPAANATTAPTEPRNMTEAVLMMMAAQKKSEIPAHTTGGTVWDAEAGKPVRQGAAGFGLRPIYPGKTG